MPSGRIAVATTAPTQQRSTGAPGATSFKSKPHSIRRDNFKPTRTRTPADTCWSGVHKQQRNHHQRSKATHHPLSNASPAGVFISTQQSTR
ncbi:hypothetical protein AVEN_88916-1 [Araneus ventricosus]|uniref:Uncharacterized protein n=1 Tax=Araneus ventricosus TaxID=182803 RepID=A0A4Y2TK94_ARAVE|nr:hypothetical protein AVEN_190507-1 [Araneus ventricosus]GBO01089.1 hypothetical protein AVEN_88916-1 [Araneus ventricosus]